MLSNTRLPLNPTLRVLSYNIMMVWKSALWQLIVYKGSSIVSIKSHSNSEGSRSIDYNNCWAKRTDPTLNSVSDLYSKLDFFLYKN